MWLTTAFKYIVMRLLYAFPSRAVYSFEHVCCDGVGLKIAIMVI